MFCNTNAISAVETLWTTPIYTVFPVVPMKLLLPFPERFGSISAKHRLPFNTRAVGRQWLNLPLCLVPIAVIGDKSCWVSWKNHSWYRAVHIIIWVKVGLILFINKVSEWVGFSGTAWIWRWTKYGPLIPAKPPDREAYVPKAATGQLLAHVPSEAVSTITRDGSNLLR